MSAAAEFMCLLCCCGGSGPHRGSGNLCLGCWRLLCTELLNVLPAVVEECEITKMVAAIDPKTKEKKKVGGWAVLSS